MVQIKKKKSNRSSIVRVIISNYDMKGIKELKVLYRKQGGVDTFNLEIDIDRETNKILIKNFKVKGKELHRYDFLYDEEKEFRGQSNKIEITKIDLFQKNKVIRKYCISLILFDREKKIIKAKICDLLKENPKISGIREKLREESSETERKLLDHKLCKYYSEIAQCSVEEVDSLKIYKVKRFLSYRSNMLMYFSFINDFLCSSLKDEGIQEIWKILKDKDSEMKKDGRVEKIKDYIYDNYLIKLENKNNEIDNKISKNKREIGELEELEFSEKNKKKIEILKSKNESLKLKKVYYSKDELKDDLIKIIKIFSQFRHALMHYEYKYFENIFENKENDILENNLKLNIFEKLPLIDSLKSENRTNYLSDDDSLYILGTGDNAKKIYDCYNLLCQRKNGFNKFINSFFSIDGVENDTLKKFINKRFDGEIRSLKGIINNNKFNSDSNKKNERLKLKLKRMENQKNLLNTPYIWDIHESVKYKKLYSDRKNLIQEFNEQLTGHEEHEKNLKLLNLKKEMNEITKSNSYFRLRYKMQMAFGFLMEEFNGDIKDFKNDFDPTKKSEIEKFLGRGEIYLRCKNKDEFKISKFQKVLEGLSNESELNYFDEGASNILFKFYILMYVLLPIEFKGDFLGFVKKHYYNIKNVDFLDENEVEIDSEKLQEMKDDSFFTKIRLFEKNIKRFEIIKYSISTSDDIRNYLNKLNLNIPYIESEDNKEIGIFNKNIILPIFKYYQNIFKLYNDIELHGLFKIAEKNGEKDSLLSYAIGKTLENNGYINFSNLLGEIYKSCGRDKRCNKGDISCNKKTKKKCNDYQLYNSLGDLRNGIAHLNYKEIIDGLLDNSINYRDNKDGKILNEEIFNIIKFSKDYSLDKIDLGMNFINDYYMKKEKFIFNQKQQTNIAEITPEKRSEKEKNQKLINLYKIDTKNLKEIYDTSIKIKECSNGKNLKEIYFKIDKSLKASHVQIFSRLKDIKNIRLNTVKKTLITDSSDIIGIYKREVIKQLKEQLIERFIYNEEKILMIDFYNRDEKREVPLEILLKRDKSTDLFEDVDKKLLSIQRDYKNYFTITSKGNEKNMDKIYSISIIPNKIDNLLTRDKILKKNSFNLNSVKYRFNKKIVYGKI